MARSTLTEEVGKQIDGLVQLPTERGARFYRTHVGLKVPSVTTVISVLNKPALIPWAARVEKEAALAAVREVYQDLLAVTELPSIDIVVDHVQERMTKQKAHQQVLRRASTIGTEVHKRIDWHFCGELGKKRLADPPVLSSPEAERSYAHAVEWRKETSLKVLATERKVLSLHGQYAGTLDTLADVEGKRCVLDYKTGLRVYRESFLQNAAYRLALAEEGIKTDGGYVILLPKTSEDESFQVVPVPPLAELVTPWQACLVLWRWQHVG